MTMAGYLASSLSARNFQPRVRFGSSFARSGLDSTRSVADSELRDQREQDGDIAGSVTAQSARDPFRPQLHGVLKTQLARMYVGVEGGLCHEQADQIVGEQVHPDFLFVHLRGVATEDVHAQSRFNVAKIQLSGKGLARYLGVSPARFQPLPIGTAREVFPQAARPCGIRRKGYESSRSWRGLSRELPEARGWRGLPIPVQTDKL